MRHSHFWKSRDVDGTYWADQFAQDARGRRNVVLRCDVADDLPLDAGWQAFRHMLSNKTRRHGAMFNEITWGYRSQTGSCCVTIRASVANTMGAHGIRRRHFSDYGPSHDRDVDAARNSLNVGLDDRPRADDIAAL